MKPIHQRILAILLLCIPGLLGIYGWTLIREAIFDLFANQPANWLALIGGSLLLLFALYVIGGFIFYRDKKRKKIDPRLLKYAAQEPEPRIKSTHSSSSHHIE